MTLSQQLKIQFSSPYKYLSPAEEIILDKYNNIIINKGI
jgi:hypothetical protein